MQSPNFFRFNTDGAQWTAGLGAYAYNVLGWRTAVTIGDDYDFPYTQVAGFVAEFCSLGGQVTGRLWPALGEEDYSSFIAQIPDDVDGFFLAVGGTGTVAFVKQYTQLKGNLADSIMGGVFMTDPIIQDELGVDRIVGVVTAGPTAGDSTDAKYTDYVERLGAAYPDFAANAPSVFIYNYYNNMEAILQAIESAGGAATIRRRTRPRSAASCWMRRSGRSRSTANRQAIAQQLPPAAAGRGRRRRHRGQDDRDGGERRRDVRRRVLARHAHPGSREPGVRGGNARSVDRSDHTGGAGRVSPSASRLGVGSPGTRTEAPSRSSA